MSNATRIDITIGHVFAALIRCAHLAGRGTLAVGSTGIAKTAFYQAVARDLGIGYRRLDATVMEASDLGGIPHIIDGVMRFARPEWMPTDADDGQGGIIVVEEATRPNPGVRNALLNLISEKVVNGHRLPKKWTVHGTANPANEDYSDADDLDLAFAARFSVINVKASATDWLVWAKANEVHEAVLSFIKGEPNVFDGKLSNPRAWTAISDFVKASDEMSDEHRPPKAAVEAFVAGHVGPVLAQKFMSRQRPSAPPTISGQSLLAKYRLECRHKVRALIDSERMDDVKNLVNHVITDLRNSPLDRRSEADASLAKDNLGLFMNDLPACMADMKNQLGAMAVGAP